MAGLVADLAAKASATELATVNSNLTNAIVTSQVSIEQQLDTKPCNQELVEAISTRKRSLLSTPSCRQTCSGNQNFETFFTATDVAIILCEKFQLKFI